MLAVCGPGGKVHLPPVGLRREPTGGADGIRHPRPSFQRKRALMGHGAGDIDQHFAWGGRGGGQQNLHRLAGGVSAEVHGEPGGQNRGQEREHQATENKVNARHKAHLTPFSLNGQGSDSTSGGHESGFVQWGLRRGLFWA